MSEVNPPHPIYRRVDGSHVVHTRSPLGLVRWLAVAITPSRRIESIGFYASPSGAMLALDRKWPLDAANFVARMVNLHKRLTGVL